MGIAIEALANLDIDPNDNKKLNDILDPDRDGKIHIVDLVTGLARLRGQPRRSDIVCVDLMVRSLQASVIKLEALIRDNQAHITRRDLPERMPKLAARSVEEKLQL